MCWCRMSDASMHQVNALARMSSCLGMLPIREPQPHRRMTYRAGGLLSVLMPLLQPLVNLQDQPFSIASIQAAWSVYAAHPASLSPSLPSPTRRPTRILRLQISSLARGACRPQQQQGKPCGWPLVRLAPPGVQGWLLRLMPRATHIPCKAQQHALSLIISQILGREMSPMAVHVWGRVMRFERRSYRMSNLTAGGPKGLAAASSRCRRQGRPVQTTCRTATGAVAPGGQGRPQALEHGGRARPPALASPALTQQASQQPLRCRLPQILCQGWTWSSL